MKRMLIFSMAYLPRLGGAEVAVKEITGRLSDIEWVMITLGTGREPKREKTGNVIINRIRLGDGRLAKLLFQFFAPFVALRLHQKHPFDAVWSIMAHSAGVPGAIFKFFNPRVPFILTLQEGDPPEHVERVMRPLWLLFARAFVVADIVQVISNFLGEWARRRGFEGRLEVIPNGVDIARFRGEKIPHQGIKLITTSRLVRKNALDDVIRALPDLPDVEFEILGVGSEEAALKALARQLGIESRVHFLGLIPQDELPKYLHAADIFVRPSRSEGMGNSFIEAMAAGLPVIATQEGGIADFLFDAKRNPGKEPTGWAVDKDSPLQIRAAVKNILENPEQTNKVVNTARRMVEEKYEWDMIAKVMKDKVFLPALEDNLQSS